ncbi:MAG TPA: aspartate aminotransferase family protein [Dehalococcoidales bacterium]|nr:aspartate aminotransferase family protein [Dehalococcoidales bacterium]
MISEAELAKLSYPGAPRMLTGVPGPKVQKLLAESAKYEALTRGGGGFPMIMEEGRGATIKDADGNLYIDMSAGVAVNAIGRGHPRVLEAIRKQCEIIMHTTDVTNPKRIELAKKISGIMPAGLRGNCQTAFAQSGSGAVDTAIKFARHFKGRSQLVAFQGAYHGVWCGSAALSTGYRYRHGWGPLIPGVTHMPYAYCYRCAFKMAYPSCDIQCGKFVDEALNTPYTGLDDVAAVIIESEQGEGGYVAPPPEYFQIIKKAAEKCGALYIADEVQSGAGRTGRMWCIEHSGVVPDMLTWGKGMGGDMPMAGVTFRPEINETLVEGSQPGTFAGNAVACMVSLTNIDVITDREMDLMGRASQLGEEVQGKLKDAARTVKVIGDVRGRGLMIGIEVVADQKTKEPLEADKCGEIAVKLLNRGVVMVPCGRYGNVFRFMPPLTVPRDLALKATDILIDVLKGY